MKGCDGVFHVAASMEFDMASNVNIESYVRSRIIDPAVKGIKNLMGSCLKNKSIKRIVFTSSISTLTAKDDDGRWRSVVDETCRTSIDDVWRTQASGWVYAMSKLVAEEEVFRYAKEEGIDIVSVITTTVGGPFLTPSVPSSIQVLLSPVSGDSRFFSILSAVDSRMGSIALVHIEDICNAHIFLMEQPKAEGPYLCCVGSCAMSELVHLLSQKYPSSEIQIVEQQGEKEGSLTPLISSKKLKDLGFEYKYGIEEIVQHTIDASIDFGFLPSTTK